MLVVFLYDVVADSFGSLVDLMGDESGFLVLWAIKKL